eukprot:TRINITY_DN111878_c0_g1_i1.p1 TRINITY_DN111878_c0_g1~~TRINITY_DN111878_c0_g1_i1.p1  ORF type:complete len:314 (+),score=42.44 TRINITY_DN111878_c0_g1_i1:62-943(+)
MAAHLRIFGRKCALLQRSNFGGKLVDSAVSGQCRTLSCAIQTHSSSDAWSWSAFGGIGAAVCATFVLSAPRPQQCETPSSRPAVFPQCGKWRLDRPNSDSMRPYLMGLGVPGFVARFVDAISVDLDISVDAESNELKVQDTTWFGANVTSITLGAAEVEKETRNKRKKFMLSAFEDISSDGHHQLTVKCRLFQRGEGWHSLQSFVWLEKDGILRERYVLTRPDEDDIQVTRVFRSLDSKSNSSANKGMDGRSTSPKGESGSNTLSYCVGGLGAVGLLAGVIYMFYGGSGGPRQ